MVHSDIESIGEGIDIQFTDGESEPEGSATKSDIDFIDTRYDFSETDCEQSYVPTDTDMESSITCSEDSTIQVNATGDYGEISVLDEREIDKEDGPVTQLLISGWLDEDIANQYSESPSMVQEIREEGRVLL